MPDKPGMYLVIAGHTCPFNNYTPPSLTLWSIKWTGQAGQDEQDNCSMIS